MLYISHKITK